MKCNISATYIHFLVTLLFMNIELYSMTTIKNVWILIGILI